MKRTLLIILLVIQVITACAVTAFAESDAECIAKLVYGEARGVTSTTQKAAVVWVVLNRKDDPRFPNTIQRVVTAPGQFSGYAFSNPVTSECLTIAKDVMWRYTIEKQGVRNCGRVLPSNYFYFTGNGVRNNFRQEYWSKQYWNWSLPSPYLN